MHQFLPAAVCILALIICPLTHADIFRWDTGEQIPGTEGIELAPGVELDHLSLEYAELNHDNLSSATFQASNLNKRPSAAAGDILHPDPLSPIPKRWRWISIVFPTEILRRPELSRAFSAESEFGSQY